MNAAAPRAAAAAAAGGAAAGAAPGGAAPATPAAHGGASGGSPADKGHGSSSGGKRKPGRPARNLPKVVEDEAVTLQSASKGDAQFFGCGAQQHLAYLKRLQRDMQTKQAATEDEQAYSDLMVASKRVDIWIEVLTSLNSFGVNSLDVQSVWDEQFHCSAIAPTVPWDFPHGCARLAWKQGLRHR